MVNFQAITHPKSQNYRIWIKKLWIAPHLTHNKKAQDGGAFTQGMIKSTDGADGARGTCHPHTSRLNNIVLLVQSISYKIV